jgi:DNA-binding PadR family transcriptional regulator
MKRVEIAQCDFARDHSIAIETLSRRLGALRRKGYLQVRIGRRHGERVYSLTEAGKDAFLQALPHWQRAQDRLQAALTEDDWNSLVPLCDRISRAAKVAERLRTANHLQLGNIGEMELFRGNTVPVRSEFASPQNHDACRDRNGGRS